MSLMVLDERVAEQLLAERRARGGDHHDEVWDGVYMMSPLPNNEHQELVVLLSSVFQHTVGWTGLGKVLPGANITDMEEGWTHNYRCPDVVVFLNEGRAINRETHFFGGPDFAVEIVSEFDRSREKLPFYARVGVRELLLVDRGPWVLELFRLQENRLMPVGRSTLENPDVLASKVLPLSFGLVPGETRPRIALAHEDGMARWVL